MRDTDFEVLVRLRCAEELLRLARISVDSSVCALSDGARRARAVELTKRIGEDVAFAHRVGMVVEGDIHADGAVS